MILAPDEADLLVVGTQGTIDEQRMLESKIRGIPRVNALVARGDLSCNPRHVARVVPEMWIIAFLFVDQVSGFQDKPILDRIGVEKLLDPRIVSHSVEDDEACSRREAGVGGGRL